MQQVAKKQREQLRQTEMQEASTTKSEQISVSDCLYMHDIPYLCKCFKVTIFACHLRLTLHVFLTYKHI